MSLAEHPRSPGLQEEGVLNSVRNKWIVAIIASSAILVIATLALSYFGTISYFGAPPTAFSDRTAAAGLVFTPMLDNTMMGHQMDPGGTVGDFNDDGYNDNHSAFLPAGRHRSPPGMIQRLHLGK